MKNIRTFEELLEEKYGKKGTPERDQFDADSLAFRLGIMLKEARIEAHLTLEELAEKTVTKKSFLFPQARMRAFPFSLYSLIITSVGILSC